MEIARKLLSTPVIKKEKKTIDKDRLEEGKTESKGKTKPEQFQFNKILSN